MTKRKTSQLNNISEKQDLYAEARELLIGMWANTVHLAVLARRSQSPENSRLKGAVAEHFFQVVANQAIWAATEVSSHQSWKYGAQPFMTKEARDQIEAGGVDRYQGLRHEHVIERKFLVEKLKNANSEDEVIRILRLAYSCVVTKKQDDAMREASKKSKASGKARYAMLKICTSSHCGSAEDIFPSDA